MVISINVSLDRGNYTSKPANGAKVNQNLGRAEAQEQLTLEEFCQALRDGSAFCCALRADGQGRWARKEANFYSCQVFYFDIDNGVDWQSDHEVHYNIMQSGLMPTYIYKTFSYTDAKPKWRVLFVTDIPEYDPDKVKAIQKGLLQKFPFADRLHDSVRMLYPGLGCNSFSPSAITPLAEMHKLAFAAPFSQKTAGKPTYRSTIYKKASTAEMSYADKVEINKVRIKVMAAIAEPLGDSYFAKNSGYQTLWHCARALAQFEAVQPEQIESWLIKLIHQNAEAWQDSQHWGNFEQIIRNAIAWQNQKSTEETATV